MVPSDTPLSIAPSPIAPLTDDVTLGPTPLPDAPLPTVSARSKLLTLLGTIPFWLCHLACLGAIWTGFGVWEAVLCLGLYYVRMFGVTAGYHRYFAHRSYRTSRWFQFVLAWLAMSSTQKGVLWWAGHHRTHHQHSDEAGDVHSPKLDGFWWSHVGWILSTRYNQTDWARIKDMASFPELRWLNRWWLLPPVTLAVGLYLLGGWSWLIWGFFVSTVLLWHGTFTINSLSHVLGSRRYPTTDTSKNNWYLALLTMGEGWHNNHHHYMSSVKQGFFWWEFDATYYVLKVLSWLGIVWDLRQPPREMLARG